MVPQQINIGQFVIHLYGVIIAFAIYVGWQLAKKRSNLCKIPKSTLDSPVILAPLVLGIVFARLYHVVDYWRFYKGDFAAIVRIDNGGLGIWGGIFGAVVGFAIFSKVKRLNSLAILDLAAPSIVLGQAIGRIGNWVNQEGFGKPTGMPWGVFIDIKHRPVEFEFFTHFHPTFFYEAILDLIIFVFLIVFSRKSKKPGIVFALYLILYSAARFLVEFWRIDTATINGVKVAQVLSIVAVMLGLAILLKTKKETSR